MTRRVLVLACALLTGAVGVARASEPRAKASGGRRDSVDCEARFARFERAPSAPARGDRTRA